MAAAAARQGNGHQTGERRTRRGVMRWSPLLLAALLLLAACGTAATTPNGSTVQPTATATIEPGSKGPLPSLATTPGATQPTATPTTAPPAPSASAPTSPGTQPSPSAIPSALPSASTRSAAPSAVPSQAPASIAATGQACPGSYPWAAYTGPEGQRWYRSPTSTAMFYRQPPTLCFVSEAEAQAAGYTPDTRPSRATKSSDGTCPQDNPVKGFTDGQGRQVYLSPGAPGYAAQKATDCFSDTGVAEYYGFTSASAAGPAPSASARPSGGASPSPSPKPSSAPAAALAPASVDFGQVAAGTTSTAQTLTLTNTSAQTIQVSTLDPQIGGANVDQFGLKFTGCGAQQVAPGATCTYTLTFRPTGGAGPRSATIYLNTGAGPSNTVMLFGIAK